MRVRVKRARTVVAVHVPAMNRECMINIGHHHNQNSESGIRTIDDGYSYRLESPTDQYLDDG